MVSDEGVRCVHLRAPLTAMEEDVMRTECD